jgi:aromatic ring-cleaving dioxygenase
MFEIVLVSPAQFGAFVPWLVINRGPLSVLVHPNTIDPASGENTEELRDHTQRAMWMGERLILDTSVLRQPIT